MGQRRVATHIARCHFLHVSFSLQARTDDGMSGADEESSAETASIKSTNSNGSKKNMKPKKSEKRKSNNPPSLRASNAGPAFTIQQQASSMLSGDNGYVSGGSQGYMSSHTGYMSSSGYDTEHQSIHGEGPEEIARILQEQRLSDPHDMAGSQFIPSQDHMTSTASHVTSNLKIGQQRGGGDLMMHGMMPHPQVMASPNQFQQQMPVFTSASQACFPSFNPTPPQDDSSIHPSVIFSDNSMAAHLSPQQLSLSGNDMNNSFPGSVPPHPNGKTSRNSSSGYSSFRSSSPAKHLVGNVTRKSPSDDGSISLRGSIMTNSYSTFSSNSSRVSSPSSTSGRGDPLRPHPPHSPQFMPPNLLAMTPHSQHLQANTPGASGGAHFEMPPTEAMGMRYPLNHSLRMSNSYPQKQTYVRRNSQDSYDGQSDASTRSWQHSSQSSRYSFARSELSDEQIEKLPTFRRDSFSKNQPLPLPESMQQDFSPVVAGMGMEFEQNGTLGMDFITTSTADHQSQSQQSQPSPMQLNVSSDPTTSTTVSHMHVSTLPLHHLDHSASSLSPVGRTMFAASQVNTMFSQDSGINDDVFFSGHGTMRTMPSPNMAIGDMASFANSLPEETQYLEQLLTNQVK